MSGKNYPTFSKMKYKVDPVKGDFSWRDVTPPPRGGPDANDRWGELIHRRYSPYAPILTPERREQVGNAILSDMGLGDYKIKYSENQTLRDPVKGGAAAQFSRDQVGIDMDAGMTKNQPAWFPATFFHEGAHAADYASDPGRHAQTGLEPGFDPKARGDEMHFIDYKSRADLMQALGEQEKIEGGQEPSKNMLMAYPWLGKVNPLSSNLLAGPWRERLKEPTAFTPEGWNKRAMAAWGMSPALNVYGRIRDNRKNLP